MFPRPQVRHATKKDVLILIWELKIGESGTIGERQALRYAEWTRSHPETIQTPEKPLPIDVFLVENRGRVTLRSVDEDGRVIVTEYNRSWGSSCPVESF